MDIRLELNEAETVLALVLIVLGASTLNGDAPTALQALLHAVGIRDENPNVETSLHKKVAAAVEALKRPKEQAS